MKFERDVFKLQHDVAASLALGQPRSTFPVSTYIRHLSDFINGEVDFWTKEAALQSSLSETRCGGTFGNLMKKLMQELSMTSSR